MCFIFTQSWWQARHSNRSSVNLTNSYQEKQSYGTQPIPAKGFPSPRAEKAKQTLRFCKWTSLEIVLRSCLAKCLIKNCFLSISCQNMSPPLNIFFPYLVTCLRFFSFPRINNSFWVIKMSFALSDRTHLYIEKAFETFHQWLERGILPWNDFTNSDEMSSFKFQMSLLTEISGLFHIAAYFFF